MRRHFTTKPRRHKVEFAIYDLRGGVAAFGGKPRNSF
jgi:hypothetical protein